MAATCSAWADEIASDQIEAIIVNTSGCGTTLKDYGDLMKHDPVHAETAKRISSLAMDISEYLIQKIDLPALPQQQMSIAYHAACSLQHGQKVLKAPKDLLV